MRILIFPVINHKFLSTLGLRLFVLPFFSLFFMLFAYKSYFSSTNLSGSKFYRLIYEKINDTPTTNSTSNVLEYFYSELSEDELDNSETLFRWCPYSFGEQEDYVDCEKLFSNESKNETFYQFAKDWKSPCEFDDFFMMNLTENCRNFKEAFPFHWPKGTTDEINFPLAYVLLVAKNVEQIVRLLQSIYRPWNLYCITYDNKTNFEFQQSVRNLNSCFPNVILPDEFVNVHWAGFSILQSVMNCMRSLNDHPTKWRYVQILSWNDFPLKTNLEMVKIMQIFNGSQDVQLAEGQPERFRQFHLESDVDESKKGWKKPLPPGNIQIYKGSMSATLSREFINFSLTDTLAEKFYEWSKTTWAAEEQFFPSLVHNLHIGAPGAFPGTCLPYYNFDETEKRFVSRFQIWYDNCDGQLTSSSCVFGVGDLHKLYNKRELIAHKFYLDFEPATYYCMAKLHHLKTYNSSFIYLNTEFYRNLPAVRYQHSQNKSMFFC